MVIASIKDLEELLDRARKCTDAGKQNFPGMSYEDGVAAALEFTLGGMDVAMDDVLPPSEEY